MGGCTCGRCAAGSDKQSAAYRQRDLRAARAAVSPQARQADAPVARCVVGPPRPVGPCCDEGGGAAWRRALCTAEGSRGLGACDRDDPCDGHRVTVCLSCAAPAGSCSRSSGRSCTGAGQCRRGVRTCTDTCTCCYCAWTCIVARAGQYAAETSFADPVRASGASGNTVAYCTSLGSRSRRPGARWCYGRIRCGRYGTHFAGRARAADADAAGADAAIATPAAAAARSTGADGDAGLWCAAGWGRAVDQPHSTKGRSHASAVRRLERSLAHLDLELGCSQSTGVSRSSEAAG